MWNLFWSRTSLGNSNQVLFFIQEGLCGIDICYSPSSFYSHNHQGVLKVHQFLGRGCLHLYIGLYYIILIFREEGGGQLLTEVVFLRVFGCMSALLQFFIRVWLLWVRNSVGWADLLISVLWCYWTDDFVYGVFGTSFYFLFSGCSEHLFPVSHS